MKSRELKELVEQGESSVLEFKRKATTPQKLAKEICALANTKGGRLLVGIDDDGSFVGVRSEKTEVDIIEQACNFFINPPVVHTIEILNYKNMDIVLVYIPQSTIKPHTLSFEDEATKKTYRRAYIRIGEKSIIASKEMTKLMTTISEDKPLKLSIGDKEKRLFTYLENHETATVKEFAKLVNISDRRAERLLIRLVRAGVLQIHNEETRDYFTLV